MAKVFALNFKLNKLFLLTAMLIALTSCNFDDALPEPDPCLEQLGDVILVSQTQVNEFGQCGYTVLPQKLVIRDASGGSDRITDLTPLSSITSIGGSLFIQGNFQLSNLQGLNNIESALFLFISNNANLPNLNGLTKLKVDAIEIGDNPVLQSTAGLNNLDSSIRRFQVYDCPMFTGLDCLINVNTFTDRLALTENESLTNLDQLSNLSSFTGELVFRSNTSLSDFCGLTTLAQNGVGGIDYEVSGNAYNPSFADLENGVCSL